MIIPPFAGVRLVEYRDRIELTPFSWYREIIGLGKFQADKVAPAFGDDMYPAFNALIGNGEIWVIAVWHRFEDGQEEAIRLECLDSQATEAEAKKSFDAAIRFQNLSKQELEGLSSCFAATVEDEDYIESRFPEIPNGPPDPKFTDDYDLYQARLKVLAGIHPKTVELIRKADTTDDLTKRGKMEREAVQAYFAELAHYWTEDLVLAWQRSNPVGTEWMCEFARVFQEAERELDPINHELVLNWLRRKYNLLTAEELSDSVLIATLQRLTPGTLKKRRERLGLTTKRPPGPPPKSRQ